MGMNRHDNSGKVYKVEQMQFSQGGTMASRQVERSVAETQRLVADAPDGSQCSVRRTRGASTPPMAPEMSRVTEIVGGDPAGRKPMANARVREEPDEDDDEDDAEDQDDDEDDDEDDGNSDGYSE